MGFVPGETVRVTLHSTPVVLGTATADADGRVVDDRHDPRRRRAGPTRSSWSARPRAHRSTGSTSRSAESPTRPAALPATGATGSGWLGAARRLGVALVALGRRADRVAQAARDGSRGTAPDGRRRTRRVAVAGAPRRARGAGLRGAGGRGPALAAVDRGRQPRGGVAACPRAATASPSSSTSSAFGGGVQVRCAPQPVTLRLRRAHAGRVHLRRHARFPGLLCRIDGEPADGPVRERRLRRPRTGRTGTRRARRRHGPTAPRAPAAASRRRAAWRAGRSATGASPAPQGPPCPAADHDHPPADDDHHHRPVGRRGRRRRRRRRRHRRPGAVADPGGDAGHDDDRPAGVDHDDRGRRAERRARTRARTATTTATRPRGRAASADGGRPVAARPSARSSGSVVAAGLGVGRASRSARRRRGVGGGARPDGAAAAARCTRARGGCGRSGWRRPPAAPPTRSCCC